MLSLSPLGAIVSRFIHVNAGARETVDNKDTVTTPQPVTSALELKYLGVMVFARAVRQAWRWIVAFLSILHWSPRKRTDVAVTDAPFSTPRSASGPLTVAPWIAMVAIVALLGLTFASGEQPGLTSSSDDQRHGAATDGEPEGISAYGLATDEDLASASASASPGTGREAVDAVGTDTRQVVGGARAKPTSKPRPNPPKPTPVPTAAPATPPPAQAPPTSDPTAAPTPKPPDPAPSAPPPPPASGQKLLFGLGPTVDSAKDARLVQEAPVRMLSVWYNGPGDLGWLTDAYHRGMYSTQYAAGRSLHLIVWTGDPEGSVSTGYGTGCGRAYPLSSRFVDDMRQLAGALSGGGTLYVTLFTEFQTYACSDNAWNPTAETNRYWRALKDQYHAARSAIRAAAPNARVSLGWGGWQMRWDDTATGGGRSMLQHFADVMSASDFQSFQAMQSDTNVTDVRAMTQALGRYGQVMLAHHKPNNGSQATFDADVAAMLTDGFIGEMRSYGLFAWSFMDQANFSSEAAYQAVRTAVQRHGQ